MWALLPWRLIFVVLGIGAVLGAAWYELDSYGDRRYAEGATEVTNRWNAAEQGRRKLDDEQHAIDEAKRAKQQTEANAEAAAHVQALAEARARADALAADGDRLRATIRAIAGTHRDPPAGAAPPAGDADGAAVAFGGLLESCSLVAERSASQAEGLADQVRGLQSFIETLIDKDGVKPH